MTIEKVEGKWRATSCRSVHRGVERKDPYACAALRNNEGGAAEGVMVSAPPPVTAPPVQYTPTIGDLIVSVHEAMQRKATQKQDIEGRLQ